MIATADELLSYLADLVEEIEWMAVTVLPPNNKDEIELGREPDGSLVIDLECQPPARRRSAPVDMDIFERWRSIGQGHYERSDYQFELRHHELDYRRAFHRHDEEHFLAAYDVATHEHCEVTMGNVACGHYGGDPVVDAHDGFARIYDAWLANAKPDCAALACLDIDR
ncbi:MAG: hypothetical protein HY264_01420 [Chloroflexi bacterium]|nr:hypothetical protein [Chloroflexota bacterium]